MGVDYICTEPDVYTYNFLVGRLQSLSGELVYTEGQEQEFFKRVYKYIQSKAKAEDSKQDITIMRILQQSDAFAGVSDRIAASVVESLVEAPGTDISKSSEVIQAAKAVVQNFKAAQGTQGEEVKEEVVDLSGGDEEEGEPEEGENKRGPY